MTQGPGLPQCPSSSPSAWGTGLPWGGPSPVLTKSSPASSGGAGGHGRELPLPPEQQPAGSAGLARTCACTRLHTLTHACTHTLTHCSRPRGLPSPPLLPLMGPHGAGGMQGPDPAPVLGPGQAPGAGGGGGGAGHPSVSPVSLGLFLRGLNWYPLVPLGSGAVALGWLGRSHQPSPSPGKGCGCKTPCRKISF